MTSEPGDDLRKQVNEAFKRQEDAAIAIGDDKLRTAIAQAIGFAVQGIQEMSGGSGIENYYKQRAGWINSQTDKILALFKAAEIEARKEELDMVLKRRGAQPEPNEHDRWVVGHYERRMAELEQANNRKEPK